MSSTIWKFQTNGGNISLREGDTDIEVPLYSISLSAGLDPQGRLCIWMMVDPNREEKETKRVYVRGTGHDCTELDTSSVKFLGSVLDRSYVWHVFIDV